MSVIKDIIKEIEKSIVIEEVIEVYDEYYKEGFVKFCLPYGFSHTIEVCATMTYFNMLNILYTYKECVERIVSLIVFDIKQEFLDTTINKKEN